MKGWTRANTALTAMCITVDMGIAYAIKGS